MASKLHNLEKQYILENYPKFGLTPVAQELNRSVNTVLKFAKDNNLVINKRDSLGIEIPKFLVNLDFYKIFEDGITPELAYFMGFFWADGFVHGSTLTIEIVKEDGEQMRETFNEIFPFSENFRNRSNRKPQMSFSACNKKVVELLNSLGKYPKSIESHEKVYNYINDENLWKYFLRGLIDGDGNFYINNTEKYAQFTISSSLNQDWTFLLENLKDFNPKVQKTERTTGSFSSFRITGRDNIIKLINYLQYPTISIGLIRKQQKALEIIDMYKENPPKENKHVLQFDKDHNLIKEYNSIKEASQLTKIGKSAISNCVHKISKSAGGYIWEYKDKESIK